MFVDTSVATAIEDFEATFDVLEDGSTMTGHLVDLRRVPGGGKQIHDCNIVAAMLAHDVKYILTDNVVHFERYSPVIEVLHPAHLPT